MPCCRLGLPNPGSVVSQQFLLPPVVVLQSFGVHGIHPTSLGGRYSGVGRVPASLSVMVSPEMASSARGLLPFELVFAVYVESINLSSILIATGFT